MITDREREALEEARAAWSAMSEAEQEQVLDAVDMANRHGCSLGALCRYLHLRQQEELREWDFLAWVAAQAGGRIVLAPGGDDGDPRAAAPDADNGRQE
jgi:hypothetical protein